jgi:hypothetical protein
LVNKNIRCVDSYYAVSREQHSGWRRTSRSRWGFTKEGLLMETHLSLKFLNEDRRPTQHLLSRGTKWIIVVSGPRTSEQKTVEVTECW